METRARSVAPSLTESEIPSHEPGVTTTFSTDEARRASK